MRFCRLRLALLAETALAADTREQIVRAFHDRILGQGAVPLDVLEKTVDTWINSSREKP